MPLSAQALIILPVLLAVGVVMLVYHGRASRGLIPARRPLPTLDALRAALGRGAETGRPIHVSPGVGSIGSAIGARSSTGDTLAGLNLAERVSGEAALNGATVLFSSGDAVAHLALRGIARQAYARAGQSQDYDSSRIQLLTHRNELAYANGVMALHRRQQFEASLLVGSFGQEALLITEDGAQRGVSQVAGTTNPVALPLMKLSADATLIGEEIFAAEAYLTPAAAPQARLMVQDLLRTVVIVLILAGLVYSLVQPTLGLPPLPGL